MFTSLPPILLYLLSVILSAAISMYTVKKVIFITRKRRIYDIPDNIRKIHGEQIPSLGGIGIFTGFIAAAPLFITSDFKGWNYMVISLVILFFTGVYDDIMNMRPSKKLLAQLIASAITVYFADIRLQSLYDWLGMGELNYWLTIGLTTFLCTFFINVFNFIDGIDGLACMMAIIYAAVAGGLFILSGQAAAACVAFCLLGATIGLLYYNYSPARIYMGDTGSMISGFTIFILLMLVLQAPGGNAVAGLSPIHSGSEALTIIVAMLFLPVFDALRVFAVRASRGISPLRADRRHLHYYLLDAGLTHAQSAWILSGTTLITIVIGYTLRGAAPALALAAIALPSIAITLIARKLRKARPQGL